MLFQKATSRVHEQLFAPKSAHDVAAVFRPTAAALIGRFAEAGGGDAVADVTTPMADALFDSVSRLQLLPVEHLNGRSGHVLSEACRNLFKHAGWHLLELARNPELCDVLRRQPELDTQFIEEILRLEPMVPSCQRFTTQPTTVGEVELPADVVLNLCIGAVQRDGSDPMSTDDLVIGVRAHRHWTLGAGSMRCRGGTSSGRCYACWLRSGSTGPGILSWSPISGRRPSSQRLRVCCFCRSCRSVTEGLVLLICCPDPTISTTRQVSSTARSAATRSGIDEAIAEFERDAERGTDDGPDGPVDS